MQYYWETMKVDMSKMLMAEEKISIAAKAVSIKVFAIKEEVRNRYIELYCEYCKKVFHYKFTMWRIQKLKYLQREILFDWAPEIPLFKA